MRRLITVAIAILAMASFALAQDEFNVNTNPSANANPAGNANPTGGDCAGTYNATMEKLNEQELEAQGEQRKDVVNCNHDQGCLDAATRKYEAAHNQVLKGEVDADANRIICIDRVNLSSALASDAQKPDPCRSRYDQTMSGLAEQEALAQAQNRKDEIDCQPLADRTGCRDAATQKFEAANKKVLNGQTDADTSRRVCLDRQALAQSETSSPANPGGAQTPQAAPTPFTGLAGGAAKNVPANSPSASNANSPASSGTPVKGIAQVPKLAPVTGPVSAPAPKKALQAGINKNEFRNPPKPIPQPPPPNSIAKNQPAGSSSGRSGKAISNAGQVGAGAGSSEQVPNGRATVHGPLRIVREGADWVAKHLPGGESGVKAAADYSKKLKQPFEDRWTKESDGGIREVGETVAGHGIGKVAGKLLGAAASKIAESPIGRAILDRFPKFPRLTAAVAKDAEESESAANRAAQNSPPPSRNPGPPQRANGPARQQQARNSGNGPGSSSNSNAAAKQQRMRQAQNQGQSPRQQQAGNQPQNSGGPNNSPNNRAPQQQPPQRPGQNNSPQQQARNQPRNPGGPNNSANNRGPQQQQPNRPGQNNSPQQQARNQPQNPGRPNNSPNNRAPQQQQPNRPGENGPQQQARNDPRLQSGAGAVGGKSEEFVPPRPTIKPTVVSDGFGGYKAYWGSDPKAFAMFRPEKGGVVVSDLFRGAQPSGSAGIMLADAIRKGGLQRPASITFSNIIEERTLGELKAGMAPGETLLGKTLGNASKDLGARVVGWTTGVTNGKPWMTGVLAYQ